MVEFRNAFYKPSGSPRKEHFETAIWAKPVPVLI